jgi:hypothetical protein
MTKPKSEFSVKVERIPNLDRELRDNIRKDLDLILGKFSSRNEFELRFQAVNLLYQPFGDLLENPYCKPAIDALSNSRLVEYNKQILEGLFDSTKEDQYKRMLDEGNLGVLKMVTNLWTAGMIGFDAEKLFEEKGIKYLEHEFMIEKDKILVPSYGHIIKRNSEMVQVANIKELYKREERYY